MSEKGLGVYKAIVAVQADLAREGIAKDKTCTQGATYKFRGIDDVYNALAPFLAKHGLCILPRILSKETVERTSKSGGAVFYTTVEAEFDFVSSEDGSMHTVRTYGEAMDSGDKGCNKSMSAAYKYAAFQAFCIPTEGDNDSENQTHEVKPQKQQQPAKSAAQGQASTTGTQVQGGEKKATEGQVKLLNGKITKSGIARDDFKAKYALAHVEDLPMSKVNDAIKWLDEAITAAAS